MQLDRRNGIVCQEAQRKVPDPAGRVGVKAFHRFAIK